MCAGAWEEYQLLKARDDWFDAQQQQRAQLAQAREEEEGACRERERRAHTSQMSASNGNDAAADHSGRAPPSPMTAYKQGAIPLSALQPHDIIPSLNCGGGGDGDKGGRGAGFKAFVFVSIGSTVSAGAAAALPSSSPLRRPVNIAHVADRAVGRLCARTGLGGGSAPLPPRRQQQPQRTHYPWSARTTNAAPADVLAAERRLYLQSVLTSGGNGGSGDGAGGALPRELVEALGNAQASNNNSSDGTSLIPTTAPASSSSSSLSTQQALEAPQRSGSTDRSAASPPPTPAGDPVRDALAVREGVSAVTGEAVSARHNNPVVGPGAWGGVPWDLPSAQAPAAPHTFIAPPPPPILNAVPPEMPVDIDGDIGQLLAWADGLDAAWMD